MQRAPLADTKPKVIRRDLSVTGAERLGTAVRMLSRDARWHPKVLVRDGLVPYVPTTPGRSF